MKHELNPLALSQKQDVDLFSSSYIFKMYSNGHGRFIDNVRPHFLSYRSWYYLDDNGSIELSTVPRTELSIFLGLSVVLFSLVELFLFSSGSLAVSSGIGMHMVACLLLCGLGSFVYYMLTWFGYREWIKIDSSTSTVDKGIQFFGLQLSRENCVKARDDIVEVHLHFLNLTSDEFSEIEDGKSSRPLYFACSLFTYDDEYFHLFAKEGDNLQDVPGVAKEISLALNVPLRMVFEDESLSIENRKSLIGMSRHDG
jgi:hypothetical protein